MISVMKINRVLLCSMLALGMTACATTRSYQKLPTVPYADLVCMGKESKTKTIWHVRVDFNNAIMSVEGDDLVLDMIAEPKHGTLVMYSENFISEDSQYMYDAVISDGKRFFLYQYLVMPKKFLAGIELACHAERVR